MLVKFKSAIFLVLKSSQQIVTKCFPSIKENVWSSTSRKELREGRPNFSMDFSLGCHLRDLKYFAFIHQQLLLISNITEITTDRSILLGRLKDQFIINTEFSYLHASLKNNLF